MKKLKIITIILLFMTVSTGEFSQSNYPYLYPNCVPVPNPPPNTPDVIGGQSKPESIDKYTNISNAYFPILIVYVQFANDPNPDPDAVWAVGHPPNYFGTTIATSKHTNTNWWQAYNENTETLSDYWMQVSRGHLHCVGQEVSIVLSHEWTYYIHDTILPPPYNDTISIGIQYVNNEIYDSLKINHPEINWTSYDRWQCNSAGSFTYTNDHYTDMIYMVFRTNEPRLGLPAGSIAWLYPSYPHNYDYLIYGDPNLGTQIYIEAGLGGTGSGVTVTSGYSPINKNWLVSTVAHEHGHYLFGEEHQRYGKMMGQNADFGLDNYLSPYESMQMGYMQPQIVNFSNPTYTIGDITSRNSDTIGQILDVPINGQNEFFLIANREKVSDYEKIMWGDTAHGDPFKSINVDFGKGIYIYHMNPGSSGYPYQCSNDEESASGLYNWVQQGYETPDWSCTQQIPFWVRGSVSYSNDNGGDYYSYTSHDNKSFGVGGYSALVTDWFDIGKPEYPQCQNGDGTDKVSTDTMNYWTSRGWQGTRWDAWRVGYNEVFSPYSSPSTCDWNSDNTGIFIYLSNQNSRNNTATLNIYKVGQSGYTLDSILQLVPPSRPMGLTISLSSCINNVQHPVLTWNQNQEPSMVSSDGNEIYAILKAVSSNTSTIPVNYYILGYYHVPPTQTPQYTDNYTDIDCSRSQNFTQYVRYEIQAVDKYSKTSVPSDFVSTSALVTRNGQNLINPNSLPKVFSLNQNYPNPFNPTTEIKYSIPKDAHVKLIVYDLLGKEVIPLVNEFKPAGFYNVRFDGTNLASGVYFYRIEAADFSSVKKMVLIK